MFRWSEDGKSFIMNDKERLIDQLAEFFQINSIRFFYRQLSHYRFTVIRNKKTPIEYKHPLFERDAYAKMMTVGRDSQREISTIEVDDFYLEHIKLSDAYDETMKSAQLLRRQLKELITENARILEDEVVWRAEFSQRLRFLMFVLVYLATNYTDKRGERIVKVPTMARITKPNLGREEFIQIVSSGRLPSMIRQQAVDLL